jgi:hypothetical protein
MNTWTFIELFSRNCIFIEYEWSYQRILAVEKANTWLPLVEWKMLASSCVWQLGEMSLTAVSRIFIFWMTESLFWNFVHFPHADEVFLLTVH